VWANDQQTQQVCVNAAICLLAVRSGLSPDRRSDLQLHHTSLAVRSGLVLNTYDQTGVGGRDVSWVTRFGTETRPPLR
jgi:hypothetical protein